MSGDLQSLYVMSTSQFSDIKRLTSLVSDIPVKCAGLLAQFSAAVALVSQTTSPQAYIPLGVAVFIEGGMGVRREW